MNINELIGSVENSRPKRHQKAILWGREALLVEAVELFLKSGATWEVTKISWDQGVDFLLRQMENIKPDVVIIFQDKDAGDPALPIWLIREQACLKVVSMSLESNLMQVYAKYNVLIRDVSDLLMAVDATYFPYPFTKSGGEK